MSEKYQGNTCCGVKNTKEIRDFQDGDQSLRLRLDDTMEEEQDSLSTRNGSLGHRDDSPVVESQIGDCSEKPFDLGQSRSFDD